MIEASFENGDELFDEKDEDESIEIPMGSRNIHFNTPTRRVKDLYDSFKQIELDPRPAFQRGYVWDQKKASRLVESILLNVPIPPIYTSQREDATEIVIDGQQRLVSLFSFIDGQFPGDHKEFKLQGLQVLKELNGKSFKELDKALQRIFLSYGLQTIVITKDSDADVKFEIFRRLNTGSVKLNDQELRNCISRGAYNDLVKELSENKDFQFILNSPKLHGRMLDSELILRFFALHHNTYLKYRSPMKQFLNKDMEKYRNLDAEEIEELKNAFFKSVELTKTVFGNNAFRRFVRGSSKDPNGGWETTKINKGLFDIIMFGFTQYEKQQTVPFADSIREELLWLMTSNDSFIDALAGSGTDRSQKMRLKFETWLAALRTILGYNKPEPRAFSHRLKEQLFKADPTCAICNQRIQTVDDSEVDHIDFYWRGGKTVPENARLAHRFCNRSRGARDSR